MKTPLIEGNLNNLKSAKDILTHILQTEEEIKLFCEANNINTKNQHIFTLGKVLKNYLQFISSCDVS